MCFVVAMTGTSEITKPSHIPKNTTLPECQLEREWVYGLSSRHIRHHVFIDPAGNIVYPAGSMLVKHNPVLNTQHHYAHHTDEITWYGNCVE